MYFVIDHSIYFLVFESSLKDVAVHNIVVPQSALLGCKDPYFLKVCHGGNPFLPRYIGIIFVLYYVYLLQFFSDFHNSNQ